MSKPFIPLHTLSLLTKIAVGVLTFTLIVGQSATITAMVLELNSPSYKFSIIPAFWVGLMAPGFYLCALWAASNVFTRMDKGDAFGEATVKGLKEVGSNLIWGAAAAIFIAPTLNLLIETDFQRLTGLKYDFEIESLTIGLIGFTLYLLAQQGQSLKSELDQIV
ncbi:hypothetical protein MMA231_03253 [Asticcacaulis sp. MM231]|uniref:DUF2975 domain-containing protein n=1 Tax=Asticcacaulis sp. MM231 TaxID=3157666 RepID=UPI0032D5A7C9